MMTKERKEELWLKSHLHEMVDPSLLAETISEIDRLLLVIDRLEDHRCGESDNHHFRKRDKVGLFGEAT